MKTYQQHRYPGLAPFTEEQARLFFGRREDIKSLYELVFRQSQTVLYAKSGLGKSSVINAGLLPLIRSQHPELCCLSLRFGVYTGEDAISPLDTIIRRIEESLPNADYEMMNQLILNENSLWYHIKARQAKGQRAFFLVIDQFEELFSYPEDDIYRFKKQLSDLLHRTMPARFRKAASRHDMEGEQFRFLNQAPDVRILFSIREDRYSQLHQLQDFLPELLHRPYALQALSLEQAKEAIIEPARCEMSGYITSPFAYSAEALERILNYLSAGGKQNVETTQLQILCHHLEMLNLPEIKVENIPDFNNIFLDYYYQCLDALPQAHRREAQLFVESQMIRQGQRISIDSRLLPEHIDEEVLRVFLHEQHLWRAERNTTGGISYELAHDSLIAPIAQAKERREALEAVEEQRQQALEQAAAEQQRAEALRQALKTESAERERKQSQLRQTRIYLGISLLTLLVALISGFWAWYAQGKAQAASARFEQALEDLEEKDNENTYLIENLYFFDRLNRRFAPAYRDGRFAYMDGRGALLLGGDTEDLNKPYRYTQATLFSFETGLARVEEKGKVFLIDTLGLQLELAERLENLNANIEALDLSNRQLKTIPEQVFANPQLQVLILSNNLLRTWDARLAKLPKLRVLILAHNELEILPKEALAELPELQRLNLSYNRLNSLEASTFDQLPQLQELNLAGNALSALPAQLFDQLKALQKLDLSLNAFDKLQGSPFAQLANLRYLDLSRNALSQVSPELFKGLQTLQSLRLSHNRLTQLPDSAFVELGALLELKLQNNQLQSLSQGLFAKQGQLRRLRLGSNKLQSLNKGCFQHLTSLERLLLDTNAIHTLEPGCFQGLNQLKLLNLSANQLRRLTKGSFMGLPLLRQLDLDRNGMEEMELGCFDSLPQMRILALMNNALKRIQTNQFQGMPMLQSLYLDYNQIQKIEAQSFTGIPRLKDLYLGSNQIQELPSACLDPLPRLYDLDLNTNTLLSLPPQMLAKNKEIRFVNLSRNRLQNVDKQLFEHNPQLVEINLSHNQIGACPVLSNKPRLRNLYLAHNAFQDVDLAQLQKLLALEELRLGHNRLTDFPATLAEEMPKLLDLDLGGNQIKGFQAAHFRPFKNLRRLVLAGNPMPESNQVSLGLNPASLLLWVEPESD